MAADRPRIAFYIGSLQQGGNERHVIRLLKSLPQEGFAVDLVVNQKTGPLLEQVEGLGIEPTEIPLTATIQGRIRFIWQLAQYLRWGQFDVLQAFNDISMFYAGLATILARRPVLVCSQRHTWDYDSRLKFDLIAWTYRHLARYVLVNSQATYQIVLRECGVPAERIRVVYNGVELRPPRSPDSPRRRRAALGLPTDVLTVGLVARLVPLKQVDVLIHAAQELSDLPVQFVVVGDGPLRSELQHQIGECGLANRFWLVGFQQDPLIWMEAFDIGVICSKNEGLPEVIMEYMAAGVPIVSFNLGGISEVVIDGETGCLVPPGDSAALAEALRRLLIDPGLRHRLGVSGQARARQHFSLTQEVAAYANAYRA